MTKFTHIHSSSRYDRSLASLEASAARYNSDAELVTYTEVEFERRERALRRANGKAFGLVSGDESNANDCAIAYSKERFELLYEEQFQNATQVIYRTDGHPRELPYTTIGIFKDKKNGKTFIVGVAHLASSVQAELQKGNWDYRRANQWRQSFKNSRRRINRLAKKHKVDARLFVADFNVDFKLPWVRALVASYAPAYMNTWRNVKVEGGTHGKRLIDATLLRGGIGVKRSARLYQDDASSDHRPYIETLVWL